MLDLIIKNGWVVNATHSQQTDIAVKDGKIVAMGQTSLFPEAEKTVDADGLWILPGMIDTHVHMYKDVYKRQEEITGLPVIDIEKDADGTYTLTARIKNGDEDAKYQFLWSNGVIGDTVTGVAADKLIGTTLTVTAEQRFGELSTQLQVPDAPAAAITAQQDALEIRWPAAAERDNQPAPTEYVLSVYQGETLVQTISVDGHASGTVVEGLKEDTAYTVKLYALSPVGRSDIAAFDAKTLAAGTEAPEKETPGMLSLIHI